MALLPLALAACGGKVAGQGTWIGEVTPTSAGPTCTKSRGLAQIRGEAATFVPGEGTWILVGIAEPGGRITAERITTGADRKPYETRLEGRWTAEAVTGTYVTPRCAFAVTLRRS